MIVRPPRLSVDSEEARLVARVESETQAFDPFELTIGVPRVYVGWLDMSGNPYVPMLHLLAGTLGERLVVEAGVSPRLLHGANSAAEKYRTWWNTDAVSIIAEAKEAGHRPGAAGAGLFFTRGVDCWYSALRAQAGGMAERITHLLYVPAIDVMYSSRNRRLALRSTEEAAAVLGWPLLPVTFNGRELLDRFVDWYRAYGGVLAGIGLALGGWLEAVVLAGELWNDIAHIPTGSHPDLVPLWSTERTRLRVDGCERTRTAKILRIAAHPEAVARLKVCWEADTERNCGQCEKCLRTACALRIAGIDQQYDLFDRPLTPQAVAALPYRDSPILNAMWADVYDHLPASSGFHELHRAIQTRLGPRHPAARQTDSRIGHDLVIEVGAEQSIPLLSPAMRRLLPGTVTRLDTEAPETTTSPRLHLCWTEPAPGRWPLPPRPSLPEGLAILQVCRANWARPIAWCLFDVAGPDSAYLLRRLTESWGVGVACLPRDSAGGTDHGTPFDESSRIQRNSLIRVWWGNSRDLDGILVLEALRHGCLPLQCVTEEDHAELVARLPAGLEAFTLPIPATGAIPRLTPTARRERLKRGLSVVLAGCLERDLTQVLSQWKAA